MDGLRRAPSRCAPREIRDDELASTIRKTLEMRPPGATHWSLRTMAREIGHAPSTVHRIWRAFGLQPHRVQTFKLSSDPVFVEKVRDVVGLYLSPPERAIVLCVDEKSQVQALDRTQPLLSMRPGQAERRAHDYRRHGRTSLSASARVIPTTSTPRAVPSAHISRPSWPAAPKTRIGSLMRRCRAARRDRRRSGCGATTSRCRGTSARFSPSRFRNSPAASSQARA